MAFALEHSPDLGVATVRVSRAQAEIEAQRPIFPSDPVLSGGLGLRRSQGRSGVDYQVGLSQEIDLAGKRATRIRVAKAGLVAQNSRLDLARWRVHQMVHALYHRAVVERERVRAATRFTEFGTRVMQVAQQRFQAGETSELPARLAETEVAEAKQALVAARSRYRAVQLQLAQASGWPIGNLPEPLEGLDEPEKTPPVPRLVALAKQADPELRAARAKNEVARLEVAAAERGAWPNPVVGVHYERESEPGGPPSHVIGGTLSFAVPLWRGSEPEQLRARAALDQARAEAKRTETVIETEVARAAQAVDSSAERVQLFGKEIVPTSGKNLSLIERAFELGEIDMTQVLVARERFLRTQEAALRAYEDYYDALANLEAALGAELETNSSHTHRGQHGGEP
jgi:cobalt-zinc-cadmium efflux system outer membrane protein